MMYEESGQNGTKVNGEGITQLFYRNDLAPAIALEVDCKYTDDIK